jgi:hypothetical protein
MLLLRSLRTEVNLAPHCGVTWCIYVVVPFATMCLRGTFARFLKSSVGGLAFGGYPASLKQYRLISGCVSACTGPPLGA